MDTSISSFQPDPISTHSRQMFPLHIGISADNPFEGARVVIENLQPQRARLSDANETGPRVVRSDPVNLELGRNNVVHEIRFELPASEAPGVVVGVEIYVEDADGNRISRVFQLLATVKS